MFIALIVMVALSLAAIALVRSVDTSNAIVGNLSFRMASILPGNLGVEKAAAALFQDADIANAVRIPDHNADWAAENYFASRQPGEDARGYSAEAAEEGELPVRGTDRQRFRGRTATEIRYVIERMCTQPGVPTVATCELLPPKFNPGGTENEEKFGFDGAPFYRVTIRVDGPQNTASFLQATLK